MPAHGKPPAERAREALQRLEEQGGEQSFPDVLKSSDVTPLMGRGWFGDALRLDMLPGMQARAGGVWRCEKAAFLKWLRTLGQVMPAETAQEQISNDAAA